MDGRSQPITETTNTSDARRSWSRLLNQVSRQEKRVVVERGGIPVAALVSVEDLKRLQWLDRERGEHFKALEVSWEAFKDVPDDEVEREVAKAVAEARAELRAEREQAAKQR